MTLQTMPPQAQEQPHVHANADSEEPEHKERTVDSGCDSDEGSRGGKPSMKEVAACFHLPIEVAAKQLGVGQTWLKLLCRSNGVARWPFRKIQSLQNSLDRSKKMQSLVEVAKVINQNLPKWLDLEGEAPRVTIPANGAESEVDGQKTSHAHREASPVTRPEPLRAGCDLLARPKPLSLDTGVWRRPTPQNQSEAAPLTLPTASTTTNQPLVSAEEYAFRLRVLAQQQQALSAIAAELGQGTAGVGPGSSLPLMAGPTMTGDAAAAAARQREWGSVLQHALAKQQFAVAEKRGAELPATTLPLSLDFSSLTSANLADFYRQRAANEIATSQALLGASSHPMPVLPLYGDSAALVGLRGFGGLGSQPYAMTPNFEQLFATSAAQQALSLEQLAKMRS